MENLPALSNATLPAYLQNKSDKGTSIVNALLTGAPVSVSRISLKQGRFRIREGQDEFIIEQLHLDTVIVGSVAGVSKIYYAKPWNPGDEPTQPDCQSVLGDQPNADSPDPQNAICATCPKNEWGSKLTPQGTEIKACSDTRRIAVVPADDPEKVYLLIVPAASMKNLTKYVKELSMRGFTPDMVRTRLTFDTEASYPLLNFGFAGFVAEEVYAEVQERIVSPEINDVLGLTSARIAKPKAIAAPVAPTPAPTAPAAVPPPAPEQQIATEPEAPKRGFGRGRPRGSKNAAKEVAPAPAAPAPEPAAPVRGFGGVKAPATAAPAAPKPVTTQPVVVPGNALAELESQLDTLLSS